VRLEPTAANKTGPTSKSKNKSIARLCSSNGDQALPAYDIMSGWQNFSAGFEGIDSSLMIGSQHEPGFRLSMAFNL
jgi:hypothetical protein